MEHYLHKCTILNGIIGGSMAGQNHIKKDVSSKSLWFFPYIIIFYETTLYLSNDMYLPGMPVIQSDLLLNQNQTQATLTFWFIGASALQLILGPLSDRYGRKKILEISCLLFILSSAACAMAKSLEVFLIARFIQGTAICSLLAAYAAIHELYETKQAIKLLAIVSSVTILAPALGPLMGALIVQFADWRYIFWILSAMGTLSWLSLYYMPESNAEKLKVNICEVINDYASIVKNKNFYLPSISYFLLIVIEFSWIFESPFIIIELFKESPIFYGVTQAVIFSFYFIGAIATKLTLDRFSVWHLIKTALWVTLFGTTMFLVTSILFNNLFLAIASMCLISVGSSMLFGPLYRVAIEACTEPMGRRTAIFSNGISLAGVATGLILTIMNSEGLLPLAILIICCALIITILIYKSEPSE